jgi:RNA polymerase sigma-70 factor (ECF subfamily)
MTITSNLCIDRLRRRKLEPTSFADYAQPAQGDDDPVEIEFVSREPQPDDALSRKQRDATIQAMLNDLPVEDRSMVAMFYFNELSYDDIAKAMNTTVSAVKSRLFRARQKMAQSKWVAQLV